MLRKHATIEKEQEIKQQTEVPPSPPNPNHRGGAVPHKQYAKRGGMCEHYAAQKRAADLNDRNMKLSHVHNVANRYTANHVPQGQ